MSSPDHSTSNNEDVFSSNISDYVSTIPDYSPASSRKKTYSNASNNSIELDNSLWITPRPLGEEPVPEELNELDTHLWK
nr:hypothetical protein [Tanacetum cinerariifolium]